MHHAMNLIGFMISPELYVVQDRVHGGPFTTLLVGDSPKPHMV
jgi:hypothetical protein